MHGGELCSALLMVCIVVICWIVSLGLSSWPGCDCIQVVLTCHVLLAVNSGLACLHVIVCFVTAVITRSIYSYPGISCVLSHQMLAAIPEHARPPSYAQCK